METKETMTLLNKSTGELETFNIHTGELVAREGELTPTHQYTIEVSDAIANLIREGKTYAQVSQLTKIPLHLIYRWRSGYPDFKKKLADARKDRATYFHDKAVAVLEDSDTIEKEEVPGKKFQFDSYLKLAGADSPTEYAPQPKVAQQAAPATIIINTGIDRTPIHVQGNEDEQITIPSTASIREEQNQGSEQTRGAFKEIPDGGRGEEESRREEAGSESPSDEATRGSSSPEESNQEEGCEKESDKEESN